MKLRGALAEHRVHPTSSWKDSRSNHCPHSLISSACQSPFQIPFHVRFSGRVAWLSVIVLMVLAATFFRRVYVICPLMFPEELLHSDQ
jgi:hypothetical protein